LIVVIFDSAVPFPVKEEIIFNKSITEIAFLL